MTNFHHPGLLAVTAMFATLSSPVVAQGQPGSDTQRLPKTMRLPQAVVLPVGKNEIVIDG